MSTRKKIVAVIAGVAVFAAVSASAATLGGLQTNDLGANSNTVKAQVSAGVAISWTTAYNATLKGYEVTAIALTQLPSGALPATANVKVTLRDAAGASLGEYTSANGGTTWTAPASTVSANSVYGASVVINGGSVTAAVTGTP
jgi:hypothetical protein